MKGMGNIQKMMKQAKEMQDRLQKEMAEMRVEGSSVAQRRFNDPAVDTEPVISQQNLHTSPSSFEFCLSSAVTGSL